MSNYTIIHKPTIEELVAAVTEAWALSWRPTGGVCVTPEGEYAQALVRKGESWGYATNPL